MPYCPDCGNETRFDWYVEQHETRVYDPNTGELADVKKCEVYDSYALRCCECGSEGVEVG